MQERGAAGTARLVSSVLCRDAAGRVLVVRPAYRDGWLLPGGAVDAGESPRVGAIRELREETGLLRDCTALLAVDFLAGKDGPRPKPDLVQHLFDGGVVTAAEAAAVVAQDGELVEVAWMAVADAAAALRPNQERLLRAGLEALDRGGAVGLERGAPIDGASTWRPTDAKAVRRVVFIGGSGHSGSTLLGLLLGSHPDAVYGGELRKARVDVPDRKRTCRRCGDACEVWRDIRDDRGRCVYDALAAATRRGVVVDSTKLVRWIRSESRRLALGGVPSALVHLERDGRAVVCSRLRKVPDADPAALIRDWQERRADTEALRAAWDGPTATVRYEDLAVDPEATLRRLCERIGLPYDPAMLAYDERDHHAISGNAGTHAATLAAQGRDAGALEERPAFYREGRGAIRLDERWRTELPPHVQDLFERMVGADA